MKLNTGILVALVTLSAAAVASPMPPTNDAVSVPSDTRRSFLPRYLVAPKWVPKFVPTVAPKPKIAPPPATADAADGGDVGKEPEHGPESPSLFQLTIPKEYEVDQDNEDSDAYDANDANNDYEANNHHSKDEQNDDPAAYSDDE